MKLLQELPKTGELLSMKSWIFLTPSQSINICTANKDDIQITQNIA
jgi:hypothetical protein